MCCFFFQPMQSASKEWRERDVVFAPFVLSVTENAVEWCLIVLTLSKHSATTLQCPADHSLL